MSLARLPQWFLKRQDSFYIIRRMDFEKGVNSLEAELDYRFVLVIKNSSGQMYIQGHVSESSVIDSVKNAVLNPESEEKVYFIWDNEKQEYLNYHVSVSLSCEEI